MRTVKLTKPGVTEGGIFRYGPATILWNSTPKAGEYLLMTVLVLTAGIGWPCDPLEWEEWKLTLQKGGEQISGPIFVGGEFVCFRVSIILEWFSRFQLEPSHDQNS